VLATFLSAFGLLCANLILMFSLRKRQPMYRSSRNLAEGLKVPSILQTFAKIGLNLVIYDRKPKTLNTPCPASPCTLKWYRF